MYAKLFTSIYQGTLRGNTHGLVVFTNLLAHADSAGWVDIHPKAIAEEVGLTLEQVQAAIHDLESPDPESRSPEEEGRRIVRLDEHRSWGWKIVNHAKYHAIRSADDRREQNRIAQAKWRARKHGSVLTVIESKQASAESAHTDTDADVDVVNTPLSTEVYVETKSRRPPCPTEELISLYHKRLPMLPRVEVISPTRKRALSARWAEVVTDKEFKSKEDPAKEAIEWFDWFFDYVAKSRFLTGKAKDWKADFDFLLTPSKFAKIVEGSYHKGAA